MRVSFPPPFNPLELFYSLGFEPGRKDDADCPHKNSSLPLIACQKFQLSPGSGPRGSLDFLERGPLWWLSLGHPLFFDRSKNLQNLVLRRRKAFGLVGLAIRYFI